MDLWEHFQHTEEEDRLAATAQARDRAFKESLHHTVADIANQRTYKAMLESVKDWTIPELPQLDDITDVIIDLETSGLRWWDGDRMVGFGLWTPDGQRRYYPVRHKLGPNLDLQVVRRWFQEQMKHRKLTNIRTKFDLHMLRADGIDLEAQGCTFGDVAHYAALLDDHRRLFNQHDLVLAFLGEEGGKVRRAYGYDLDPTKFAEYPAGLVAPRAEDDVLQVALLKEAMWGKLTDQDLHTVREIEEQIIPVVVEMEHNGALLDVETLDRWVKETERDLKKIAHKIRRRTGIDFEKFTNRDAQLRLFRALKIEPPLDPEQPRNPDTGEPKYSFADALLKPITHPDVQGLRAGLQIESLRSKFLLKYQRSVARDGILRYELHQVPYQDDKEGKGGAVSGRFSSAAPSREEGANIQQVFGVETQQKHRNFTRKYLIKKLFIPADPKAQYVNADASQLQFRFFAHYADDPKIVAAYQRDNDWRDIDALAARLRAAGVKKLPKEAKLTDFHDVVGDLIKQYAHKELIRTHVKNVNFAQVFGAGVRKMAAQLGVPPDQIPDFDESLSAGGPLFQEVVQLSKTYHTMFPSVKPLLALTSHLAMPGHKTDGKGKCGWACEAFHRQGYEHRGWVRTYLGRRARFPHMGDRFYSALNRVIQGTEGDYIKRVMIEVHKERHRIGFLERFTVHDALAGDLHEDPRHMKELLNTQFYDFRVQILWEVGVGRTWADAK